MADNKETEKSPQAEPWRSPRKEADIANHQAFLRYLLEHDMLRPGDEL